jgi:DNA modification methylase
MTKLVDRIEHWPIDRPIPYARNARTHSLGQVAQIAGSIREFGFTAPILVDGQGGVIAGHGRLLAARQLGLATVPVVVLDHLTETQKRAYIIADNKLALNAGWDEQLLALELQDLKMAEFDLDLTGFGDEEIDRLLDDLEPEREGLTDDDAAPPAPRTPVSRPGDVWLMGRHRLLCGDATSPASIATVMAGGLADMVFTDPPYNVAYGDSMRDQLRGTARPMLNDDLGADFEGFLRNACAALLAVTKGAIYMAMSGQELHTLQRAFIAAGGHWSTFVIWAKHTFTLGRGDYQRQHEPILYGWREGNQHYWCGARDQGDVWFIKKPQVNDLHPTMKPVELVERAIRNSSKTQDTILDPFGGSGTTLIASEKTGRIARLVELDPIYCDVIVERWQAYTGQAARREADGASLDALREAANVD